MSSAVISAMSPQHNHHETDYAKSTTALNFGDFLMNICEAFSAETNRN